MAPLFRRCDVDDDHFADETAVVHFAAESIHRRHVVSFSLRRDRLELAIEEGLSTFLPFSGFLQLVSLRTHSFLMSSISPPGFSTSTNTSSVRDWMLKSSSI